MKIFEYIKNIWKITELRDRISLTLGLIVVYRFGAQVVLPGIDASKLGQLADSTDQGILGLLNAFTGGAFANASVFALGIMPYISASIVVQLMGIAVPYLQKLQKEGASGQKKITQIIQRVFLDFMELMNHSKFIEILHIMKQLVTKYQRFHYNFLRCYIYSQLNMEVN